MLIYKRPQQAMRNDILQLRTEMISPVQGVEGEETAVQTQPQLIRKAEKDKSHYKWTPLQENRLFYLCLKGASRKLQSQVIQREPMHIFSKVQKHILLLKKIKESIETTKFAEF